MSRRHGQTQGLSEKAEIQHRSTPTAHYGVCAVVSLFSVLEYSVSTLCCVEDC